MARNLEIIDKGGVHHVDIGGTPRQPRDGD